MQRTTHHFVGLTFLNFEKCTELAHFVHGNQTRRTRGLRKKVIELRLTFCPYGFPTLE